MEVLSYEPGHLDAVIALCRAESWPTYPSDPARADTALRASGTVTLVAVDGDAVIGFAHAMSDGIEAYLAVLAVARHRRREGVGGRLIDEIFARTGVSRMDLLSAAGEFYRSRPHTTFEGFRLYPHGARSISE